MTIQLQFGIAGNAHTHQRAGWSQAEEGFTWSIGRASEMLLPVPPGDCDRTLELHVRPFLAPVLAGQQLGVLANGVLLGQAFLRDETILCLQVPRTITNGAGALHIVFEQPDAKSPAASGTGRDTRALAFAFHDLELRAAAAPLPFTAKSRPKLPGDTRETLAYAAQGCTGLPLHQLAASFESLGRNCEFGLVQRQFGADPLGLLRFASIHPTRLLAGLKSGFEGIAAPGNLEVYQIAGDPSREWMVRDRRYGTETHTFQSEGQISPTEVLRQAERRYALLHRKFMENLREGSRIWVFQHPLVQSEHVARAITEALQTFGPNTLLWVSVDPTRPAGSVGTLQQGLLHGAIDWLAPDGQAGDGNLPAWTSLLANAYRLWRESEYGQPAESG